MAPVCCWKRGFAFRVTAERGEVGGGIAGTVGRESNVTPRRASGRIGFWRRLFEDVEHGAGLVAQVVFLESHEHRGFP